MGQARRRQRRPRRPQVGRRDASPQCKSPEAIDADQRGAAAGSNACVTPRRVGRELPRERSSITEPLTVRSGHSQTHERPRDGNGCRMPDLGLGRKVTEVLVAWVMMIPPRRDRAKRPRRAGRRIRLSPQGAESWCSARLITGAGWPPPRQELVRWRKLIVPYFQPRHLHSPAAVHESPSAYVSQPGPTV
jgi:hypothetical protein